jgi:cell division protein FtsB
MEKNPEMLQNKILEVVEYLKNEVTRLTQEIEKLQKENTELRTKIFCLESNIPEEIGYAN